MQKTQKSHEHVYTGHAYIDTAYLDKNGVPNLCDRRTKITRRMMPTDS